MFLISLLLSLLVLAVFRWYFKRRKLPPGPPAVPLLGCLPFLQVRRGLVDWGTDPRVSRHRLATVSLGPANIFVINNLQLAKELFDREDFSGRKVTEWLKVVKVLNGKTRGIIATQGDHWLKQRRFGLRSLRDLGFARRGIEDIINEEMDQITEKLIREADDDEDFLVENIFNIPVINVLWQLVGGYRFNEADSDSEGRDVINNITKIFRNSSYMAFLPLGLIKLFNNHFFEENLKLVTNQRKYIEDQIEKHSATLDRENPRDFIDVYLTAMEKDEELNKDDLAINLYDFLLAGTETSATTLKWLVLYLTLHQEVQDRCREEIIRVIGANRCRLEDIVSLPYTQATVAEVHRLAAIGPLALAHKTRGWVEVEGYTFPPGSSFMSNLQFIMRDPNNFQHPETFNPARFIEEDGRYKKHPALVPFGIGKRQCMGEALARNEVLLFTVGLVQRLTFLPPGSGRPLPDPEDYHVGVTRMPNNFYVRIVQNKT